MNSQETRFKYFRYPHEFSTYVSDAQACGLCGKLEVGYRGPFYGEADIDFVCEPCLSQGKLAAHRLFTNNGDIARLRSQLETGPSQFQPGHIEALILERKAELEQRTPHLVTWQDLVWPAHCGNFCCFIREVGKPDLTNLAHDGDGHQFFLQHLYDGNDEFDDVWEAIRPDSPNDNSVSYDVAAYLFQCLECSRHTLLWDCN